MLILTVLMVGMAFFIEDKTQAAETLSPTIVALFLVLFSARCYYSEDRKDYLKNNWLDLVLIVFITSPLLRLLLALKIVGLYPKKFIKNSVHFSKKQLLNLIMISKDSLPASLAIVFGVVIVFGTAAWLFEHGTNQAFSTIDDGLWWAFVTITTVGYGDIVPQTGAGRAVASLAMIFGILVYSLVIANITNFLEKEGEKQRKSFKSKLSKTDNAQDSQEAQSSKESQR